MFSALQALDRAATRAVARAHSPRRTRLLLAVTVLGSVKFLLPGAVSAAAVLVALGRDRWAETIGIAMLAGWSVSPAAKRIFGRGRPDLWPPLATAPTHSFPSQHALLSAVFFGGTAAAASTLVPETWASAAIFALAGLIVAAVGFSRVYLGAHWTTDVAGGILIGLLLLAAAAIAANRISPRQMPGDSASLRPRALTGPGRGGTMPPRESSSTPEAV